MTETTAADSNQFRYSNSSASSALFRKTKNKGKKIRQVQE